MVKKLSKRIEKKVNKFILALKTDLNQIERIFLFGSYAKDEMTRDSDIDLCVVSSDFKKKNPWNYLWKKRIEIDDFYIQPIGYAPEDFIDENPLVWEIKKTGIRIM